MRHYPIVLMLLGGLVACSDHKEEQKPGQTVAQKINITRSQDAQKIQRGYVLFSHNCASCHGKHGEGAPNWSLPDANGKYPAPPLNGTGHAWHHPMRALVSTIRFGTRRIGGSMPAWKDTLSDQDIDDIIAWFQSTWPDELYAAWQRTDQAARQK